MELRDKILKSAYNLFATKGFEKTTVADIINQADCSKGGFYHHFRSKNDVIDGITMNYVADLRKSYKKIIENKDRSVIDIMNNLIIIVNKIKEERVNEWPKVSKIFMFEGNDAIINKMVNEFELVTTEFYEELIVLGISEGVFSVKHPKFLAEVITKEIFKLYEKATTVVMSKDENSINEFQNRLDFFEDLLNKTLGVENNIIKIKNNTINYIINENNHVIEKYKLDIQ